MMGLDIDPRPSGLAISINFKSDVDVHLSHESGGYQEPDETEITSKSIRTKVDCINFSDGQEVKFENPEIAQYVLKINKLIEGNEIPDLLDSIIGFNKLLNSSKPN